MTRDVDLACAALLAMLLLPGPGLAGAQEADKDVLAEDFETNRLDQLAFQVDMRPASKPKNLAVVQDGKAKALLLEGAMHSRVFFSDRKFGDCTLQTRMKKGKGSYGGVVVRDTVFVYFQMRGALCVNRQHGGLLFQSGQAFRDYHDLKVVCVGPVLRAYVDGELICAENIGEGAGRVGFYSHGGGQAYFDNFRVSPRVDPLEAVVVEPKAPGDSLVVAPGENAGLTVAASNHGGTQHTLALAAQVKHWDDSAAGQPARREIGLAPRKTAEAAIDLGRVPAGFYKVELVATVGGKEVVRYADLPLAVQERVQVSFAPPVIPVAAYSKYFNARRALYQNTYTHATARILREHHFNAIVADPAFTKEMIDIFQSYGIATISRDSAWLDHPAVIATLSSDEPKPHEINDLKQRYEQLLEKGGKPVTTCIVGEGMGLGGDHDPVNLWRRLDARLRAFRWYGVKKSYYGTLHDLKYKGVLPLASVLRIAEASQDTPWWFVPPSFGKTDHETYFQGPKPAQMKGMMHTAMANGAHGLMLWCLQSWGDTPALIQQQSLQAPDGKLAAAAEVAKLIARHAPLLKSSRYGYFAVENSNPLCIEAVPRRTESGQALLYVVNKDEGNPASATLSVTVHGDCPDFRGSAAKMGLSPSACERLPLALQVGTGTELKDLFRGRTYSLKPAAGGSKSFEVTLPPGDAALVDLAVTIPPAPPVEKLSGAVAPAAELVSRIGKAVARDGTAVLGLPLDPKAIIPGDAIGLSRADDPRYAWARAGSATPCLNWSGRLDARTGPGLLPLPSALRVAEAAVTQASSDVPDVETAVKAARERATYWTLYQAAAGASPAELRAMIHLALAYGSRAVLVAESLPPELSAIVDEAANLVARHGKTLAGLKHGGFDVRCKNVKVAAIPRSSRGDDGTDTLCVYAVNLDMRQAVTAELLLWDDVWNWTKARNVFAGEDLVVKPRDEEGYLGCQITLRPGEGRLIATDASVKPKPKKK